MWRTFLPKKSENVRPHSSNSIENATSSSGSSPLASYKEVPPSRNTDFFYYFIEGWIAFNGFHREISLFFFFELRTLISAVIVLTHLLGKQSEIPKVISPYACNLPYISETKSII